MTYITQTHTKQTKIEEEKNSISCLNKVKQEIKKTKHLSTGCRSFFYFYSICCCLPAALTRFRLKPIRQLQCTLGGFLRIDCTGLPDEPSHRLPSMHPCIQWHLFGLRTETTFGNQCFTQCIHLQFTT